VQDKKPTLGGGTRERKNSLSLMLRSVLPVVIGFPLLFGVLSMVLRALFPERFHLTITPTVGAYLYLFAGALCFSIPTFWIAASSFRRENELLRSSEDRYRQLFDSNPHPMWVYDPATLKFLAVNEAAITKYGYSREEFLQMTTAQICWQEDVFRLSEPAATADGSFAQLAEGRHKTKDGRTLDVEISSDVLEWRGQAARLMLASDVTDKKKVQNQLFRAQRMESIGTLAGGIAHDLNNILSPIIMGAQLIKENPYDESTPRIIDTILISATRGGSIVRQILTFARGAEGERVTVQLRHLLNSMEQMIRQTFPKSIELSVDWPKNLWPVIGDPAQLDQVFLNLCVNARDAMSNGGTLKISASNQVLDERYTQFNVEAKAGPFVVLEVADTGIGMTLEVADRIFEPFFTTKEVGKGTGLGLATVRAIVKSHNGFINVYSEVGQGTSFKIFLPAAESETTKTAVAQAASQLPVGAGELVLVVDDEAAIREIAQITLESFNYRVLTAPNGVEAIAIYGERAKDIDIVLLDMMMPLMDGAATIPVLEKINPQVAVIETSGLADGASKAGSGDLPQVVKGVLAKPYTSEQLLKTLHRVLAPSRPIPMALAQF